MRAVRLYKLPYLPYLLELLDFLADQADPADRADAGYYLRTCLGSFVYMFTTGNSDPFLFLATENL